MSIVVRGAVETDLEWLFGEMKSFSEFFGSNKSLMPDDVDHGFKILEDLVKNHLFLIAEEDGERLGLIAGMVHPHLFNPAIKVLSEFFWWVPEEHRGSRAGLMLLNEFTKWGKDNVDWVIMTLEHHSPVNTRCLTKRNFKPRETTYMLEVN